MNKDMKETVRRHRKSDVHKLALIAIAGKKANVMGRHAEQANDKEVVGVMDRLV